MDTFDTDFLTLPTSTTRKIIGYCRVSTEKQSLDRQITDITNYCKDNNLTLTFLVSEVISSSRKKRKIDSLIDELVSGDMLIVSELSKIGRSLADIFKKIEILKQKNVFVHFININLTLKPNSESMEDKMGQFFIYFMSIIADIERSFISERTKSGLATARLKNRLIGRPKNKFKFTEPEKEKLLDNYFKLQLPLARISKLTGFSRPTLYRYKKWKAAQPVVNQEQSNFKELVDETLKLASKHKLPNKKNKTE